MPSIICRARFRPCVGVAAVYRGLSTPAARALTGPRWRDCRYCLSSTARPTTRHRPSPRPLKSSFWPEPNLSSALLAGSGLFTLGLALVQLVSVDRQEDNQNHNADSRELPHFRLSEIRQHGPTSDTPWIIYRGKVYDITEWVPAHPGGEVILRAAGGDVEPYWDIFSIHKKQYVRDILEQYVIGQVHPEDVVHGIDDAVQDPFVHDPSRDARLIERTQKPCNAETPSDALADSFLTPNSVFYVRNHMWVPTVQEADNYKIAIELPSGDTKTYTLADLKTKFRQHTVTAVLQCSGNRRKDMTDQTKGTNGIQWNIGAISCATWGGVLLRDVLADAGVSSSSEEAQHVQFSGLEAYGASIPIASALDPRGDVLLAFRMNEETLPRDHGFPVRVVVPGHVAARCVKWLRKITVSDEESPTTWQRRDYKCFGPNETKQDWDKYPSIQKMPITSAITRTRKLEGAAVQVEGYAYSGAGSRIQRVDVSLDGGRTWDQARLVEEDAQLEQGSRAWCWKRWRYEGLLPSAGSGDGNGERKTTFLVKATDDTYNTQPETQHSIYNLRGNLATAWHRVEFRWEDKT